MDTSETYIKMRVATIPDLGMGDESFALELPYFVTDNVWVAPNGNFYCHHNLGTEDVIIGCQLERQDQLQEMVIGRVFGGAYALIDWVFSWRETIWNIYQFESMEQFWLAFVMKEKHNKVWSGEEWEVIKVGVK